jgi:hypothetical protein
MVDSTPSSLGNVVQSLDGLNSRATILANVMTSPEFLNLVGRRVGIAGNQIYAAGPVDPQQPRTVQEPTAVQRNVEITGETTPYRFNFNNDPNLPSIQIYAQAPTTSMAIGLANAAVASLQKYVGTLEVRQHVFHADLVSIHPLGAAIGGVSDAGIRKSVAVLAFVGVLLLWCVLMLVLTRFRASWRASGAVVQSSEAGTGEPVGMSESHPGEHGFGSPAGSHVSYELADLGAHNGNGDGGQREPDPVGSAHAHAPASGP